MSNNQPKIDNAYLYSVYTMLYANDLACNYIKVIKGLIPETDKEAKKIYGALMKRVKNYFKAIATISDSGIYFLADFLAEIDDIVEADIENYKKALNDAFKGEETANIEYFTAVEMGRSFADLSVMTIQDICNSLAERKIDIGGISYWKLLEVQKIVNNFAKWVYRKAIVKIDLNECKGVVESFDKLRNTLCDYKNFEKAYESAIRFENERKDK